MRHLFLCLLLVGCGGGAASDDDSSSDAGGAPECFSSNDCPTGWQCSDFGVCLPPGGGDGGVPPSEVEHEIAPPVASDRFVYVAMTDQDKLARIDGQTLAVASLPVGERPRVMAVIPGTDAVVVLDAVNAAATIVRADGAQNLSHTVATLPNLNRVAVAPGGSFAVTWFDLDQAIADAGGIDGVGAIGSFQDVTVIDLRAGQEKAVDLTVGFRPRQVQFDAAGGRAYVITADGVSIIDLAAAVDAGPTLVPPIPVATDPLGEPSAIEVAVLASGDHAVIREAGRAEVRILALAGADAGTTWTIPLADEPSDIDLAPGGGRAYAVVRDAATLAVIDVPGDGLDPSAIDLIDLGGAAAGSLVLSADGATGLLFTNAVAAEQITVIRLDQPGFPHATHALQKSIRHVQLDTAGTHAVVVHAKAPGDPDTATTFDEFIDRSQGYSVLDVATGFAKLQVTSVEPGAVAFAGDDDRAYLILDGGDAEGATAEVHTLELDTGVVRVQALGSPPDAVGILPHAAIAFVSQRHPQGRITFIEIASGAVRTLTGFDLNSLIID
jgi:DNA-binding beta-propeller fold protein YncE